MFFLLRFDVLVSSPTSAQRYPLPCQPRSASTSGLGLGPGPRRVGCRPPRAPRRATLGGVAGRQVAGGGRHCPWGPVPPQALPGPPPPNCCGFHSEAAVAAASPSCGRGVPR
eukprot:EG_transcript_29801